MLRSYLKIWDWDLIFGRAVNAISSPGVRSPWKRVIQVQREKGKKIQKEYRISRCEEKKEQFLRPRCKIAVNKDNLFKRRQG